MSKLKAVMFVAVLAAGCVSDDGKPGEQGLCGAGEEVVSGDDRACVYRSELIEEGFLCPATLPNGFLLNDGGVACVGESTMPGELGDELLERGYEPSESECFQADPPALCFYDHEQPAGGAFDATNADSIKYTAGPGFGYCIGSGDIISFELDPATREVSAIIAFEGDADVDFCLADTTDPCIAGNDVRFTITEQELAEVISKLDAVPAPMCVVDAGRACDPCLVETLEVGDTAESADCCGTQATAGFEDAFGAAVAYLSTLIPESQPLIDNADSFAELTYTTAGGLGYCIEAGHLLAATITRQADGSLSVEGATAETGDEAVDDCIQGVIEPGCLVSTPFGPLTVDAQAQADLESKLANLPAPMCVEDGPRACDPCLIRDLDVDGVTATNDCCGTTSLGFDAAFADVVDAITSL